jgi:hypothetical protein
MNDFEGSDCDEIVYTDSEDLDADQEKKEFKKMINKQV